MVFITGILTVVLVLDCLLLILLVLIQLPKKEAGAGLAFGGAATDALFGAGSGNALTKVTKYATGIFFLLAIVLAVAQRGLNSRGKDLEKQLSGQSSQSAAPMPPPAPPASSPALPVAPAVGNPAPSIPAIPASEPPPKEAPPN